MSEREPAEEAVIALPNGWEARRFRIGETVKKDSGDYVFEGEIVSVFRKKSGVIRIVVEDDRGLLFIFNQNSLERV